MNTNKVISEGLSVDQLEDRLEMASNGIGVCCSCGTNVSCCDGATIGGGNNPHPGSR